MTGVFTMKIATSSNLKTTLSIGMVVALLGTAVGCTTVTPGYDNHRVYYPAGSHHDNGNYKNNGRYKQGNYNNGRYNNNRGRYNNKNGYYKNNKGRYNNKNGQYTNNGRYNNGRYQNNHYQYK